MKQLFSKLSTGGICVIAGEASGDAQGALLVHALHKLLAKQYFKNQKVPKDFFWGIGGKLLRNLGVEIIFNAEELAVVGFVEAFNQYFTHSKCHKLILLEFERRKPIAIILINYPHFNLRIAEDAYLRNIKVIFHIPPQIWARKGLSRIEKLKRYTHLVTCILPFEENFYKQHDLIVKFIGNPLFEAVKAYKCKHETLRSYNHTNFIIGLLPGSRKPEIENNFPLMIEAFDKLRNYFPNIIGYVPIAHSLQPSFLKEIFKTVCQNLNKRNLHEKIIFIENDNYKVMSNAHYAWVCSGTATLETGFFNTPMSVIYKTSYINAAIAKKIMNVKYISLVNLCMNEKIIPEFLQSDANSINLFEHAKEILTNSSIRNKMINKLSDLSKLFRHNATLIAAQEILNLL